CARAAPLYPGLGRAPSGVARWARVAGTANGGDTTAPMARRPLPDRARTPVILFINPCATRPKNRRFPLSLMAVGAALPPSVGWEIIDENLPHMDVPAAVRGYVERGAGTPDAVQLIAMTVMPGPQVVSAVRLAKVLRQAHPGLPIVWGGNFGSLYPGPVLDAPYVDWVVRGQGEQTFLDLLAVLDGSLDAKMVPGLAFKQADGSHWIGPERQWIGPAELPD